jgi:hypothetical protein
MSRTPEGAPSLCLRSLQTQGGDFDAGRSLRPAAPWKLPRASDNANRPSVYGSAATTSCTNGKPLGTPTPVMLSQPGAVNSDESVANQSRTQSVRPRKDWSYCT